MDFVSLGQAFGAMLSIKLLLFIGLGVFIGIIFGAVPGLSGTVAIVLFMPFTRSMEITTSILFLTTMFCGAEFGGSISAILIGTPGTNAATCTMLDGYPLAKQGKAKKALLMALYASVFGGVVSALTLILFAPLIAEHTLAFGPSEQFAIAVFGLSIIVSLSGKSAVKGFFAAAVGVVLSLVGIDTNTGLTRLTFSNTSLFSGITLMALLTGMFALSNIITKVSAKNQLEGEIIKLDKNDKLSLREFWKYKFAVIKGSLMGVGIGAIPGTGTGVATFLAYNSAKNSSKEPEKFGNGSLEGIGAAESSNNAVTSAAFIPLLTLGLPGAPAVAVLMGAFTMQGIAVGPMLFSNDPVMVYTIMVGLLVSNIFMLVLGKYFSSTFAKITKVPNDVLVPLLVILAALGVLSVNNSYFDLYVYVAGGFIAYFLTRLDVPIIPLVLGFVLGKTMETNLRGALAMTSGDFVAVITRPIVAVILIITVLTILYPLIKNIVVKKLQQREETLLGD